MPAAGLIAAAALTACGGDDSPTADGDIDVVAAFYPLAFATEQVGGDNVSVDNLTPAGQEPHDLELAPSDIAAIEEADYIVYLDGFMPEFDQAVAEYASDKALEVGAEVDLLDYDHGTIEDHDHDHGDEEGHDHGEEEGHDHDHGEEEGHDHDHAEDEEDDHDHGDEEGHDHGTEGVDPHLWLDPTRYAAVGEAIADGLAELDQDGADDYAAGADGFTTALAELDTEFTEGLADRAADDIVTSHAAFGYLADRYGLNQVAISGLSPDQEPTSERMGDIAAFVDSHDVTVIFFETLAPAEIADTIAAETGAETGVLNPLEGLTEDDGDGADYFSVMRDNLAALQNALGAA